ncbi:MAG: helix-turn-helix transcriptional regulator [Clostridia bacterium]|nr:helix-turn-helix transcriptional regulator [Clostridia bacterium]MCI9291478.1 helix-turn-helix transcriptional regulator [Clostridia bacterium]
MDVIKKLTELRLERNISVYRLSELTGINQSTLANTFSRGTIPSIKHLEIMCDALGVTLSQFFAQDEEMFYLSKKEIELINNYRKLPKELCRNLSDLINDISDLQKNC